jgi:hypothetical protein
VNARRVIQRGLTLMQEKLARADAWMRENPPRATDLDALESSLTEDNVAARGKK